LLEVPARRVGSGGSGVERVLGVVRGRWRAQPVPVAADDDDQAGEPPQEENRSEDDQEEAHGRKSVTAMILPTVADVPPTVDVLPAACAY